MSEVCAKCGFDSDAQVEAFRRLEVERDTLQSKLTEMEQVLEWASENVVTAWGSYTDSRKWSVFIVGATEPMEGFTGPTLYDALYEAWKSRGGK